MRAVRLFCHIAALSMLLASLTAAAQAPRLPPGNDNLSSYQNVAAPYSDSLLNLQDATIEPGEPEHPCASAASDNSIWYLVFAPAGATLVVDTSESNIDTVISVWTAVHPWGFSELTNVDCEDDGANAAKLTYPVLAMREYFISISTIGPLSSPFFAVQFDYNIPSSLRPKGQHPDTAIDLKLNGTTKLSGVEYGMHSFSGPGPTCDVGSNDYAGWFRITVPFDTLVALSTEGSVFNVNGSIYSVNTLTIYPAGVPPSQANEMDCADSGGVNGAATTSMILAAGTYLVRVSILINDQSINGPSRYKVRVRTITIATIVENGGFEAVDPMDGWTVKKATGDAISTPGEAIAGSASFKFVGGPGEKSKLQQTIVPVVPLPVDEDMIFEFGLFNESNFNSEPYSSTITLYYADGSTQKIKRNHVTISGSSGFDYEFTPTGKETLVKAKVAIKFTGTSAVLLVDNIQLSMNSAIPRGPLLLPPAPQQ